MSDPQDEHKIYTSTEDYHAHLRTVLDGQKADPDETFTDDMIKLTPVLNELGLHRLTNALGYILMGVMQQAIAEKKDVGQLANLLAGLAVLCEGSQGFHMAIDICRKESYVEPKT